MDKKITIGIDVDGVLRDNLQIMVDLYNKEFNGNMTVDDVKDYRTEITFPSIEPLTGKTANEWFFQDHSDEIFVNSKPFKYVAEDIKNLREFANVVIITYQKTVKNKMQTLTWLEKNGIEYDGIIFMKDKTKFMCDILIDDNDWNFIGSNAGYGALINAPYNKNKDVNDTKDKSHCSKIERYDDFHSFVTKFLSNKESFLNEHYKYDVFCYDTTEGSWGTPWVCYSCMTANEADDIITKFKKEDIANGCTYFVYYVREREK